MKKTIGLLCSFVLLIGSILPINNAFAEENSDVNNELVQVVLYSDEEQVIMSEVPKFYEEEYKAKLEDPNFREAEIQKSLGVSGENTLKSGGITPFASPPEEKPDGTGGSSGPYVDYMTKSDVIRILATMDKNYNWSTYISNPLTDAVLAKAVQLITKSNVVGFIAGTLTWATSWVAGKQQTWWKDSLIMILEKKINGVKLTVTPNKTGSNYPAAYITFTRY